MNPDQVRKAMRLQGGHEVLITFGPDREEWRITSRPDAKPTPIVPPQSTPPMVIQGASWRAIDPAYPLTVEISDPLQRAGNNLTAAIRRLRKMMAEHGLRETGYVEGPHSRSITFIEPDDAGTPEFREKSLKRMEQRFGVSLPADYWAFLLKPGRIRPRDLDAGYFDIMDDPFDDESIVDDFRDSLGLPKWLIPVAQSGEDVVCLAVAGPEQGRVFLWPEIEGGFDEADLERIAESFSEYHSRDDLSGRGPRGG